MKPNEGDLVLVSHYSEQNYKNILGVLIREFKQVGSRFPSYEILVDGKVNHYGALNWTIKKL